MEAAAVMFELENGLLKIVVWDLTGKRTVTSFPVDFIIRFLIDLEAHAEKD